MNKTLQNGQNGLFMLIYSDISEKMGLQEEGRIRKLCEENGMMILEERRKNMLEVESEASRANDSMVDPLHNFKAESKVILYIMTKV